ncbi:MAG: hypothetical protein OXG25_02070 [Gammaproteobacteria bacterium]|nr:hypothetical protein [Gammaproteobacteria bacterium]
MNKRIRASLGFLAKAATFVVIVSFVVYAPNASACSCDYLAYGFLGPYTSRLPANAVGIPWYVSTKAAHFRGEANWFVADESRFILEVLSEDQFVSIPLRIDVAQEFTTPVDTYMIYHIRPKDGGLKPGSTYRVSDQLEPERYGETYGDREVVVEIDHEPLSADTPLTIHIGMAKVGGFHVAASASCSEWLRVSHAKIAARLPGEFRKWEDQLLFRTIVDGEPWQVRRYLCSLVEPGRGWDGVAHDRIFAACEEPSFTPISPVITPGRHSVMIEARLPGTDIALQTEKRFVNLECSAR